MGGDLVVGTLEYLHENQGNDGENTVSMLCVMISLIDFNYLGYGGLVVRLYKQAFINIKACFIN